MSGTLSLDFVPGDETWQKLRKRGLTDLYMFSSVILGYGPRVPMTEVAHKTLCRIIERRTGVRELDTAWVRKFEMPRGVGKTTVITQAYLLQRICRNPNIAILLANEKEGTAKNILSEIKQQIQNNQLLRTLYPEIIPDDMRETTWAATQIVVKRSESRKEPTIMVIGVGGTTTGMHFDLIFVDDMLSREAMESARSGSIADVMGQINRWVHQLVPLLSGAKDRSIDFIGTRWYYGDSYEHIEESFGYGQAPQHYLLKTKLSDGSVQPLPAYKVGDVVVFRRAAIEDGQAAFASLGEDKFGLEALAKQRLQDPELFAANMMNDPSDEVTRVLKEAWLRYYDINDDGQYVFNLPSGKRVSKSLGSLDVLVFCDPGGFKKQKGGDRARGAVVTTGSTEDVHLILAAESVKQNYTAVQKDLIDAVQRFGARKVFIENAGQQIVFIDQVREKLRKLGITVVVEEVPTGNKNKDDRILGLEEFFEQAKILVGRGAKFTELLSQIEKFPKSVRKDLLDALSMAPARWRKTGGGQRSAAQRQAAELDAYYQRRGLRRPA